MRSLKAFLRSDVPVWILGTSWVVLGALSYFEVLPVLKAEAAFYPVIGLAGVAVIFVVWHQIVAYRRDSAAYAEHVRQRRETTARVQQVTPQPRQQDSASTVFDQQAA